MLGNATSNAMVAATFVIKTGLRQRMACRHYHPAPPNRVTMKSERTFEGISLDQPGFSSKQVSTLSRFQLCDACHANEAAG